MGQIGGKMTSQDQKKVEELIRTIPNFPEEGIIFRDITTSLKNT